MANTFEYLQADCTGKDFYTLADAKKFKLYNIIDNIWSISENLIEGNLWITEKNATKLTKTQAQTIVNNKITEYQNSWDSETEDYKLKFERPVTIILE